MSEQFLAHLLSVMSVLRRVFAAGLPVLGLHAGATSADLSTGSVLSLEWGVDSSDGVGQERAGFFFAPKTILQFTPHELVLEGGPPMKRR